MMRCPADRSRAELYHTRSALGGGGGQVLGDIGFRVLGVIPIVSIVVPIFGFYQFYIMDPKR